MTSKKPHWFPFQGPSVKKVSFGVHTAVECYLFVRFIESLEGLNELEKVTFYATSFKTNLIHVGSETAATILAVSS